ncbi:MAG: sulfurtransferase [Rhodothermaceae bacterium]
MKNPIVSAEWLKENLDKKEIVILDASLKSNISGDVSEFSGKQIPGARYFDIDNVFSDTSIDLPHMLCSEKQFETEARKLGIDSDSIIIVYDNVGVYSSPRAYWMFKAMGHKEICVLNGGLTGWAEAGFELDDKKETDYPEGNFKAKYDNELVRNINQIQENINSKKEIVIDARSTGRFNGTDPEPREWLQSGSISNSKNLPYTEVINGSYFKSKEELTKIIKPLDINSDKIIFSCGSGLTASILFVAFEVCEIENKKSVYDGSWTEWAQSKFFEK